MIIKMGSDMTFKWVQIWHLNEFRYDILNEFRHDILNEFRHDILNEFRHDI